MLRFAKISHHHTLSPLVRYKWFALNAVLGLRILGPIGIILHVSETCLHSQGPNDIARISQFALATSCKVETHCMVIKSWRLGCLTADRSLRLSIGKAFGFSVGLSILFIVSTMDSGYMAKLIRSWLFWSDLCMEPWKVELAMIVSWFAST